MGIIVSSRTRLGPNEAEWVIAPSKFHFGLEFCAQNFEERLRAAEVRNGNEVLVVVFQVRELDGKMAPFTVSHFCNVQLVRV